MDFVKLLSRQVLKELPVKSVNRVTRAGTRQPAGFEPQTFNELGEDRSDGNNS